MLQCLEFCCISAHSSEDYMQQGGSIECGPVCCQGVHGGLEWRCALLLAWLRLHGPHMGLCGSNCEGQVRDNTHTHSYILTQMLGYLLILHTQCDANNVALVEPLQVLFLEMTVCFIPAGIGW